MTHYNSELPPAYQVIFTRPIRRQWKEEGKELSDLLTERVGFRR
jgi:hypothetical protein